MDLKEVAPTEYGKEKYPPDGYYHETDDPCTCNEQCGHGCKGTCGCPACHAAYMDFLTVDYD